ncbi:MAG: PAS domain S-box protein, partial [Calditrichota bacterium]
MKSSTTNSHLGKNDEAKAPIHASFSDSPASREALPLTAEQTEIISSIAEGTDILIYSFFIRPNFKIRFLNQAATLWTGISEAEARVTAHRLLRVIPREDRRSLRQLEQAIDKYPIVIQFRIIKSKGRPVWTEHHFQPLNNDKGDVVGFNAIGFDISKLKETQSQLHIAETCNRYLYDDSPAIHFTVDLNGRLIDVNKQLLRFLDYQREEVINRSAIDFVAPFSQPKVLRMLQDVLAERRPQIEEVDVLAKDGSLRTLLLSPTTLRLFKDKQPV